MNRQHISIAGTAPAGATWPTWYSAAWLTLPDELRRDELQILLHGASYDHRYWDWPVESRMYSYVSWATARGAATLNLDRIGSGMSSKPPGNENTVAAQAHILSQVIDEVRRGLPGAPQFGRIVLVGHSLGSVIAGCTAGTYGDVDALVMTGYLPVDSQLIAGDALIEAAFMPAADGLAHVTGLVDGDYFTPRPESREAFLYKSDQADPGIIAVDEQMKGTATRGELRDAGTAGPIITSASCPTLGLVGEYDMLVMDLATENNCFDSARRLAAVAPRHFDYDVVSGSGHNLNLHRNAQESFEAIGRWLEARADVTSVA